MTARAGEPPTGAPPDDVEPSLASLRALPRAAPPPLAAALEAELAQLAPVAPRRPLRQLALVTVVSLAYAAIVLAVATVRADLPGLPRAWLAVYVVAWLAGFGAPLALALVPARGSMLPRANLAAAVAAVAAAAVFALGLLWAERGPASQSGGLGAGCLSIGLATALVPIVLGTLLLRGAAPVGSRLTAGALGAAAGSLGGLVLHLHCPIADRVHVGVVHAGVVVIAAVLTAAVAGPVLRPRR